MKKLDPGQWPLDNYYVYYVKGSSDGYPVEGFAVCDCGSTLYLTGGDILRPYMHGDALYEYHPCEVIPMPLWEPVENHTFDGIANSAVEPMHNYLKWRGDYQNRIDRIYGPTLRTIKTNTQEKENNK